MRLRVLLLAGLALVIALGTAHVTRSWLASQRAALAAQMKKPEKAAPRILVAAKDLATGSFIRADDLQWQAWPDDQINDHYLREDKDPGAQQSLSGAVVRLRIAAGEPLTDGRVIKPGERGFLAAVLGPGMRAVSVAVTATSGVAGLVFPGDRVDLVLSHGIKDAAAPDLPQRMVSETVITDIRVLAIDQTTDDKDGKPVLAKTVTFEVTPKQVEAIQVASELGQLSLSLRSLARRDDGVAPLPAGVSHTWDSDVSPLLRPPRAQGDAAIVTVLRGEPATGRGAASTGPMTPTPGAADAASPAKAQASKGTAP